MARAAMSKGERKMFSRIIYRHIRTIFGVDRTDDSLEWADRLAKCYLGRGDDPYLFDMIDRFNEECRELKGTAAVYLTFSHLHMAAEAIDVFRRFDPLEV